MACGATVGTYLGVRRWKVGSGGMAKMLVQVFRGVSGDTPDAI